MKKKRNSLKLVLDTISFPFRAVTIFEKDFFIFSSLQSERYYYVAEECKGRVLDLGCGRNNRFINEFLGGDGVGVDVFKYEGLSDKNIVKDMTKLPFKDSSFNTVTLIANINHIPKSIRDLELKEISRVLKKNGLLVVTMGNPIAEVAVHKLVWFYDKYLKTKVDVDSERGMEEDEEYYLSETEIRNMLLENGFIIKRKRRFISQWFLNNLYVAKVKK